MFLLWILFILLNFTISAAVFNKDGYAKLKDIGLAFLLSLFGPLGTAFFVIAAMEEYGDTIVWKKVDKDD